MGKNSAKRKFCVQSYYRDGPGRQEPSEEKKSKSFTIYNLSKNNATLFLKFIRLMARSLVVIEEMAPKC